MSKQWYLQDCRQYVGNAVLWWAKDAQGYTCDLRNAHVWTDEQKEKHRPRETDKFWPKDRIDRYLMPVFDMQKFKLIDAGKPGWSLSILDAPELLHQRDALLAALRAVKVIAVSQTQWQGDSFSFVRDLVDEAIAATKGGA